MVGVGAWVDVGDALGVGGGTGAGAGAEHAASASVARKSIRITAVIIALLLIDSAWPPYQ